MLISEIQLNLQHHLKGTIFEKYKDTIFSAVLCSYDTKNANRKFCSLVIDIGSK